MNMNINPDTLAAIKPALWGAVGGAVALATVGFQWGGWVTGGQAQALAKLQVQASQVAMLAPVCAANFRALPDVVVRTAALSKADSWRKSDSFKDASAKWVTLPGETYPNSALVEQCSALILKS
jgi:hypothetical protein